MYSGCFLSHQWFWKYDCLKTVFKTTSNAPAPPFPLLSSPLLEKAGYYAPFLWFEAVEYWKRSLSKDQCSDSGLLCEDGIWEELWLWPCRTFQRLMVIHAMWYDYGLRSSVLNQRRKRKHLIRSAGYFKISSTAKPAIKIGCLSIFQSEKGIL